MAPVRLLTRVLRAVLLAVLLVALPARAAIAAEEAAAAAGDLGEAQMQADMHRYFTGERRGGIWLMSAGAPAMALGTGLIAGQDGFLRGLGCSMLAFGAIELIGGAAFYVNSNRRVPRFDGLLRTRPAAYRDEELVRIRGVNRDMRRLEAIEITLVLAGGALTAIGEVQRQDLLAGIGAGLMIQSAVLFLYDQLAARRALRYSESLGRFAVSLTPGTPGAGLSSGGGGGGGGATLAVSGRF